MQPISAITHRNDSWLGPLEARLLRRVAAGLPGWVTPNQLSAVGVAGAALALAGYALSRLDPGWLWLACAGYTLNWFGDSLDGSLARQRAIERPRFGWLADRVCDTASQALFFIGLGVSPYFDLTLALLLLAGYLALSLLSVSAAAVLGEMQIAYGGLGPTEARLIAITANLVLLCGLNPAWQAPWGPISLMNLVLIGLGMLMLAAYVQQSAALLRRLSRLDPTPQPAAPVAPAVERQPAQGE